MTDRVPDSPSGLSKNTGVKPWDADPEMLTAKIAELLIDRLGTPTVINHEFASWYGIASGLTDAGLYDCSLRVAIFKAVAANSVNVEGRFFERVWAYLMKPKYTIMGMPFGQQEEEKKEGIFRRVANWWRGGDQANAGNQPGAK